ncbi:YadA-like family protein [Psychrobacter sp. SCQQ22]|uniref:YadA-like family protein n=1 Tax=Psychrobacter sp. SCQQ22 TaxID=2792059 RepID=UPI0018CE3CF2|nr:YadA-like family protein [Psychrobacter sp. SCQQ22]MBH0085155.1 YadA-like family protein [Psychrobacter sp. SCQQ22]
MNRIYKVIWNEALSCFTAVGEYAKGRGKSSKSSVSANATINTTSNLSSIHTLRLSAIGLGLLAAGFGMHANAVGTYFAGDDPAREIYTNPFYHQTLTIQGGETIIGSPNTKNISVTANKHDKSLTIQLDKTVDLGTDGSLKTGDTLVDHSGVKIVASNLVNTVMLGHSGLNNGNNKIINVDDGDITATSKDAVNGSQLNSLTNTVAANKTKYYSVDSNASGNLNNDGATGYNAMAMGGNAKATGSQTIAIGSSESGQHTMASGEQSIAIGANVVSRGGSSIAIGGDDLNLASIYNLDGTITDTTLNSGTVNTAFNEYAGRDLLDLSDPYAGHTESGGAASIAIGVKARTEGHLATAIGTHASASETASSAFGVASSATEKGALALGAGAQSATQNGVALGSKSIANVAGGATGFVPIGTLFIDENAIIATKSVTLGAVSVGTGSEGGNRQIVNVAAGTSNSDAVNVAQLKGLQNGINSTLDKGMDFGGDTGTPINRKLGEQLIVKGGETDSAKLSNSNNIGVIADGSDTLTLKLAKDVTGLDSVTTGNTLLNTDGVSFLGGSTVRLSSSGLNNGGNQITNVASGVGSDFNAANIGDVNRASAAAKTEVAAGTNVADVVKSTGQNGQDVYTVNANGVTTSAGSSAVTVTAGDKDMATNTTDYAVDLSEASKASLVKADSAIQTVITQIDGAEVKTLNQTDNTANFLTGDNIVLTAENGGIKVATADEVVFTSVTTGDTLLNTDGVSFLGGSTVSLSNSGLNNGGNKITNVDDGEEDTDAVNVGQLNATNSTVDLGLSFTGDDTAVVVNRKLGQTLTIQGGATELTENNIGVIADDEGNLNVRLAEDVVLGKNGSVRMENTVLNNAGITITDGPNQTITLSNEGLDNGNNRIIKVAEGIAPSDAVNFAQLTTTNDEIAKGIKIGDGNSDNDQQFALGDTINVTGDSNLTTIASETGVQVKLNNQLDLGDTGSMQVGNSIMSDAGFTFVNNGLGRMVSQVSLSSRGLDNGGNTIRNVGEGVLDTDAVNVGQLKEVTIALDQGWGITAQGDIATMVKQGDALDLNSRDGNIKVSRTSVNDATAFAASTGLQDAAIPTNANDISFDLNPDIILDSVTTGDTTMNDNGLTIAGGPSVTKSGIDAANKKITNVQNGEITAGSQDAINGSQLYAQGSGISSIIGGDTVYNSESGTFTNSNIGGTGEGNIDGAIASIRQGTIEINENVQVNTTNIATNTTNISTNTTNIATNTSNIMTNTTNIKTNTDKLDAGLNFGADSGANINKPVGDGSVLSFTGGNNITTTAEGSSIKFDLNGNISVDSVTVGTTVINNSGISMQDGPSMTAQGLYAGNQRITGVADGVEATDAVNYSQLSALDSRLNNNMSDLGYKIGEVEENANAGISAAMAMSSLPQAYIAGKSMISGGVGTYNGESAVAVGFSKLSNDGRWVMKINGTADTQGNAGGAIGAGFHFD